MPLLATPTTVEGLFTSINSLFINRGEFDQPYIVEDGRHLRLHRFYSDVEFDGTTREGGGVDAYYTTPEQAVTAIWKYVLDFKADIRNNWSKEMIEDFGGQGVTQGVSVWWGARPKLVETKNKLYMVTMRAEFT